MTRGQEAPKQIKTVHCLVINRVYFLMNEMIFISSREVKNVYFIRGFTSGMNMT